MKKSLIICEEKLVFSQSLSLAIESKLKNYQITPSKSFEDVFLLLVPNEIQLIILSINCTGNTDLFTYVDKIIQKNPEALIILIGNFNNIKIVRKLFERGIKSYFDEVTSLDELIETIPKLNKQNIYICDSAKVKMMDYLCGRDNTKNKNDEELTSRELDVLKCICDGMNGKEISEKLFISINTVETHRRNIMMKLHVKNSLGIIKYAMEHEII